MIPRGHCSSRQIKVDPSQLAASFALPLKPALWLRLPRRRSSNAFTVRNSERSLLFTSPLQASYHVGWGNALSFGRRNIAPCGSTGAEVNFVWRQKASTNKMSSELLLDIALIVVAAGVSVVAGFLMVHFWFEFRGHRR